MCLNWIEKTLLAWIFWPTVISKFNRNYKLSSNHSVFWLNFLWLIIIILHLMLATMSTKYWEILQEIQNKNQKLVKNGLSNLQFVIVCDLRWPLLQRKLEIWLKAFDTVNFPNINFDINQAIFHENQRLRKGWRC